MPYRNPTYQSNNLEESPYPTTGCQPLQTLFPYDHTSLDEVNHITDDLLGATCSLIQAHLS